MGLEDKIMSVTEIILDGQNKIDYDKIMKDWFEIFKKHNSIPNTYNITYYNARKELTNNYYQGKYTIKVKK